MSTSTPAADSSGSAPPADGNWKVPLLITAFAPLVTVPLTMGLASGLIGSGDCLQVGFNGGYDYYCQPISVALTLLPGLGNLIPAFWLLSARPRTRMAAALASGLGLLRLIVPVITVLLTAAPVICGQDTPTQVCTTGVTLSANAMVEIGTGWFTPAFPNNTQFFVVILSLLLWCGTFVAWGAVGSRSQKSKSVTT